MSNVAPARLFIPAGSHDDGRKERNLSRRPLIEIGERAAIHRSQETQ